MDFSFSFPKIFLTAILGGLISFAVQDFRFNRLEIKQQAETIKELTVQRGKAVAEKELPSGHYTVVFLVDKQSGEALVRLNNQRCCEGVHFLVKDLNSVEKDSTFEIVNRDQK